MDIPGETPEGLSRDLRIYFNTTLMPAHQNGGTMEYPRKPFVV